MGSNADGGVEGAVVPGASVAPLLALGETAGVLHAAKTMANVAASAAALTDHLMGDWDIPVVSSSELSAGPSASRPAC